MSELAVSATHERSYFAWVEMAIVLLLIPVGLVLGGLTGFPPLTNIVAMALPLFAATLFLRRRGIAWKNLAFGKHQTPQQVVQSCLLALTLSYAAVISASWFMVVVVGLSALDTSALESVLQGNLVVYLWFLIPVAWGSAAIGEELLMRGYFLHRLEGKAGLQAAIIAQALIFALFHFYQGIVGVVSIFLLALVFGHVYIRAGRNLLPVILAHGVIDTVSLTLIYLGYADWLKIG
jgi:hypothetical protein